MTQAAGGGKPYCLAVVMPVYNEQGCIAKVLRSWTSMLSRLHLDYLMIVLDDGSTKRTGAILDRLKDDRIEVIHQKNGGHGPTILMGYRRAVGLADWVSQCDGDNEMPPQGCIPPSVKEATASPTPCCLPRGTPAFPSSTPIATSNW
jgi:glycosyltransferase involved in cell wall biosynthesis